MGPDADLAAEIYTNSSRIDIDHIVGFRTENCVRPGQEVNLDQTGLLP